MEGYKRHKSLRLLHNANNGEPCYIDFDSVSHSRQYCIIHTNILLRKDSSSEAINEEGQPKSNSLGIKFNSNFQSDLDYPAGETFHAAGIRIIALLYLTKMKGHSSFKFWRPVAITASGSVKSSECVAGSVWMTELITHRRTWYFVLFAFGALEFRHSRIQAHQIDMHRFSYINALLIQTQGVCLPEPCTKRDDHTKSIKYPATDDRE
ncbi:hypothetical protein M752DRAFT_223672 [Aspergillus phoenicis ATCC 13157]|uniref:Uncharacterized protein n=1 Tax=Aspergillus phoenicis ATCC 13157 TaxID=1353007 RepID=A0A370P6W6_ASPPH|nr:hypothetical protein M752DRAFT_223672 [Aspergillus phoenicis ATCC 13157]